VLFCRFKAGFAEEGGGKKRPLPLCERHSSPSSSPSAKRGRGGGKERVCLRIHMFTIWPLTWEGRERGACPCASALTSPISVEQKGKERENFDAFFPMSLRKGKGGDLLLIITLPSTYRRKSGRKFLAHFASPSWRRRIRREEEEREARPGRISLLRFIIFSPAREGKGGGKRRMVHTL